MTDLESSKHLKDGSPQRRNTREKANSTSCECCYVKCYINVGWLREGGTFTNIAKTGVMLVIRLPGAQLHEWSDWRISWGKVRGGTDSLGTATHVSKTRFVICTNYILVQVTFSFTGRSSSSSPSGNYTPSLAMLLLSTIGVISANTLSEQISALPSRFIGRLRCSEVFVPSHFHLDRVKSN